MKWDEFIKKEGVPQPEATRKEIIEVCGAALAFCTAAVSVAWLGMYMLTNLPH